MGDTDLYRTPIFLLLLPRRPDVMKRHSNVQMVDESRESRHFNDSQWVFPVC
jgi:hypothetical protein